MTAQVQRRQLLPGAVLITVGEGATAESGLIGIPAGSLKVVSQLKAAMPSRFIVPDDLYARGHVQLGGEFYVYFDQFVRGKAFRPVAPNERMVIIGTEAQLTAVRRILDITLFGFTPAEMKRWTGPQTPDGQRRALGKREIAMFRKYRAWFAPKQPGFTPNPRQPDGPLALVAFIAKVQQHRTVNAPMPIGDYATVFGIQVSQSVTSAFINRYRDDTLEHDLTLVAYEFAMRSLDDMIEFRAYDADGRAEFFPGVAVVRKGKNVFAIVPEGGEPMLVDCSVTEDQSPHLVTLSAKPHAIVPNVFTVVCLGSDSGFELEHPTTGFALGINGKWVIVDMPVGASYLLKLHGINVEDVVAVFETHKHEDHMGAGAHFFLESVATGRSVKYIAGEPAFRGTVAKIAAYRGEDEEKVARELEARGAIRVRPGEPLRLLGATWNFAWTVHPVPTTGFRVELEHGGRMYRVAYSSDTNRSDGFAGTIAMANAGFYDSADDPMLALVEGNEDLVLWEAGGTNGDPIHCTVQDRIAGYAARGINPPTIGMHIHPFPPEFRHLPLARPGDEWIIASQPPVAVADVAAVDNVIRSMPVRDPSYWLARLLYQGTIERYTPGSTVVAEGSPGDSWFAIVRGEAEVVVGGTRVGSLRAPGFFGELALLENGKRKATIRALGPLDVLRVSRDTFRDFVVENQLDAFFAEFWQRLGVLSHTRLFLGFPHSVLAALAGKVTPRTYAAGQDLIRQGTVGDELFVIKTGEVEVLKSDEHGHQETIGVRGEGEVIGEYGLLVPGGKRTATVRAGTDVEAFVLTREQITEVFAGQLPLELRIIALLKERGIVPPATAAVTI